VVNETSLGPMQTFAQIEVDGTVVGPDAVRSDIDGNIWASGAWTGYGYNGIHCLTPEGERIGHIKLPETTSNLVFGGPKRNVLFMTASTSLYTIRLTVNGCPPPWAVRQTGAGPHRSPAEIRRPASARPPGGLS
jgi:gluconolactonase